MSWAALFERAAAFDVSEAQVAEQLAERRARRAGDADAEEEAGGR